MKTLQKKVIELQLTDMQIEQVKRWLINNEYEKMKSGWTTVGQVLFDQGIARFMLYDKYAYVRFERLIQKLKRKRQRAARFRRITQAIELRLRWFVNGNVGEE